MIPREYLEEPTYKGGTEIRVCTRTIPSQQAELAIELMRHFGSVAGTPSEKEDSGGRQQLRLQSPEELVERCCNIAAQAYAEFEERGWLMEIPAPKPSRLKHEL